MRHRLVGQGVRHAALARQAVGFGRKGQERLAVRGQQRGGQLRLGAGGVARGRLLHARSLAQVGCRAEHSGDREAARGRVEGVIGVPLAERAQRGLAAIARDRQPVGMPLIGPSIGPRRHERLLRLRLRVALRRERRQHSALRVVPGVDCFGRRLARYVARFGEHLRHDVLAGVGERDGWRSRTGDLHRLSGGERRDLRVAILLDERAQADVPDVAGHRHSARVLGERPGFVAAEDVRRTAVHAEGVERRLRRIRQDIDGFRRLALRGDDQLEQAAAGRHGHLADTGHRDRRRLRKHLQAAGHVGGGRIPPGLGRRAIRRELCQYAHVPGAVVAALIDAKPVVIRAPQVALVAIRLHDRVPIHGRLAVGIQDLELGAIPLQRPLLGRIVRISDRHVVAAADVIRRQLAHLALADLHGLNHRVGLERIAGAGLRRVDRGGVKDVIVRIRHAGGVVLERNGVDLAFRIGIRGLGGPAVFEFPPFSGGRRLWGFGGLADGKLLSDDRRRANRWVLLGGLRGRGRLHAELRRQARIHAGQAASHPQVPGDQGLVRLEAAAHLVDAAILVRVRQLILLEPLASCRDGDLKLMQFRLIRLVQTAQPSKLRRVLPRLAFDAGLDLLERQLIDPVVVARSHVDHRKGDRQIVPLAVRQHVLAGAELYDFPFRVLAVRIALGNQLLGLPTKLRPLVIGIGKLRGCQRLDGQRRRERIKLLLQSAQVRRRAELLAGQPLQREAGLAQPPLDFRRDRALLIHQTGDNLRIDPVGFAEGGHELPKILPGRADLLHGAQQRTQRHVLRRGLQELRLRLLPDHLGALLLRGAHRIRRVRPGEGAEIHPQLEVFEIGRQLFRAGELVAEHEDPLLFPAHTRADVLAGTIRGGAVGLRFIPGLPGLLAQRLADCG